MWQRYADPAVWSRWAPQIRRVQASGPRLTTGLTGTVHGPLGIRARFEVLCVDESQRTWTWRVRSGPVRLELTHAVLPEGEGSRTTLEIDGPAAVVLLYAPVAGAALRGLVRP